MNIKKFNENNAELAKALVEHKKIIGELKTESSKYQRAYFDVYNEKQLLKTELNFARKTVLDLFKANTQNYTDVMQKLGIALATNNPSSKSISSSVRPNPVPIQRTLLDQVKRQVTEPIVPKKFPSNVLDEKKDTIESQKRKPTTSTSQPASDKEPSGQPNAELPQRQPVCFNMFSSRFSLLKLSGFFKMDRNFTAITSSKQGIDQHGKDKLHEPIKAVPKVIITSDGEGEELKISHTLSENSVKRSPVGKKINYDEEANTSLRELKVKKLSEKLSPVPDESNRKGIVSPLIKSTACTHHIAQPRLSYINKAKSPINESKSPANNIRNNKVASHSTKSSPNLVQQQTAVESIAKVMNTLQQVDPGERTSGTNSQPTSSGDPLNVRLNLTERGSSRNKEKYSYPLALLKRIQQQSILVSRTPKKFVATPEENVTPINTTVSDSDFDRSPQVNAPNYQYRSHRRNSSINIPLQQAGHGERRKTIAIEPIKNLNRSVQQSKLNIETPSENKIKSIANNNLQCVPSHKYINNLGETKENEGILTLKSILQKSANRSSLKTIQSPNGNADALKHQESNHDMKRQSDDSNKRRARSRTRSRDNISIDDEQPNYSGRLRRYNATTNYAEPKLNTKMRRNF